MRFFDRRMLLAALLISLIGCHHGILTKRESELNCPTDIRRTVPWCAGEDAIFHCPCGPSRVFYGHKPTCWGIWPAPGSAWRDSYCGCSATYLEDNQHMPPAPEPLPELPSQPNEDPTTLPPSSGSLFVPPSQGASKSSDNKNGTSLHKSSEEPRARTHSTTGQTERDHGTIRRISDAVESRLDPHSWVDAIFVR